MRITGGQARGIQIQVAKSGDLRPATDRTREAVFSSIAATVPGASFLDLFAGAGSYGLEALSRGARGGTFVEKNGRILGTLKANAEAVARSMGVVIDGTLRFVTADALKFRTEESYNLIFMDPPYPLARKEGEAMLARVRPWLSLENHMLVFEHPADLALRLEGWKLLRRLGKSGTNEPATSLLQLDRGSG